MTNDAAPRKRRYSPRKRAAKWERLPDAPMPNYIGHKKTPRKPYAGRMYVGKQWAVLAMLLYGSQEWKRHHGDYSFTLPVRQACASLKLSAATLKECLLALQAIGIITHTQFHPHFVWLRINPPPHLMLETHYVRHHSPLTPTNEAIGPCSRLFTDDSSDKREDSATRSDALLVRS